MLDNLFWSILANRLYYSEAWDSAKAFMLLNYVATDAASQTAAAAAMEANKTSGAGIVAQGAIAPVSRTQAAAPWYVQGSPYATGLGSTKGGTLPSTAGEVGNVLTVQPDGTVGFDPTASGGLSSIAAFGSTPDAKGASISGSALVMQPADLTHPGEVSVAAQVFGGAKTFAAGLNVAGAAPGIADGWSMGVVSTIPSLYVDEATPSSSNYVFSSKAPYGTFVNARTSEVVALRINNVNQVVVDAAGTTCTGAVLAPSISANGAPAGGAAVASLGVDTGFAGLWLNQASPSGTNYSILEAPTFGLFINTPDAGINFQVAHTTAVTIKAQAPGYVVDLATGFAIDQVSAGTSTAAPGDATLNRVAGQSAIAALATAAIITNSFVASTDVILVTLLDLDTTATSLKAVAGSGSFTVTANAAATATTKFSWCVIKCVVT